MHFSRILASVALVAVSRGAPLADKNSTESAYSTYSASVTSSASATESTSSISSSTYYPSVTPPAKPVASGSPVAVEVPIPSGKGGEDSKARTYDFDTKDEPFAITEQDTPPLIAVPPSKIDSFAPPAEAEKGKDTAVVTIPDETAVEFEGESTYDTVGEPQTSFDDAEEFGAVPAEAVEEPSTKVENAEEVGAVPAEAVEEPSTKADNAKEVGAVPSVAIEEPKFQAENGEGSAESTPGKKNCK